MPLVAAAACPHTPQLLIRPETEDRELVLRVHAAYAKVKQEAAQVWSDDRIAYTEAKTGVVLDLLDAAEIWARANCWAVIHPPG